MFSVAIVALLASAVSAVSSNLTPNGDVAANSPLGMRLLSQATVVEPARHLEENQRDVTFVAQYSLRYLGCDSLIQVAVGNGNNNNNNKNNQNGMLYTTHLARFALCPTSSCGTCSGGGEYVMSMETFVDAFTEAKLTELEYKCEQVRETCYCADIDDDQACETSCYTTAGLTDCIEYEGEENFEVQRYLECKELENKNNNDGSVYYVGPYCSSKDSYSIHLGVFSDAVCNEHADVAIYASANYGVELPFSSASLVNSDCIDCKKVNDNNNNNNGNAAYDEVSETCEAVYTYAAKCETKMDTSVNPYPDTSGCAFLNEILPHLNTASKTFGVSSSKSGKGAKAFAAIFAFTTALFAAYAYFLYRKIKRGSVDLSSQV